MDSQIKEMLDERARLIADERAALDAAAAAGRANAPEELDRHERQDKAIDELTHRIDQYIELRRREKENDAAREIIESISSPERVQTQRGDGLERWLRYGDTSGVSVDIVEGKRGVTVDLAPAARFMRQVRMGMGVAEARAIYTDGGASAGSIVAPQEWARELYQYMEAPSAIRQLARVITTVNGDQLNFEKVATHGVGTQIIAQGTAIGGTDPVFGTMSLNAFPFGQLVKVSNAAAADIGFDLLGFVAENIGYAVGRITAPQYVAGGGSAGPNGVVTAASVGAKTGGSLIALGPGAAAAATGNLDCLIDLQHSVTSEYRRNGVFVMHDSTAGTVRKTKDGGLGTVGNYLWVASTTFDPVTGNRMPDTIFGAPVYTDFSMGTNGSAVKPVIYGDLSKYYIRDAGGFRLERSDERFFDTDEIGFRGVLRTDGDLIDTNAVKVLQQAV